MNKSEDRKHGVDVTSIDQMIKRLILKRGVYDVETILNNPDLLSLAIDEMKKGMERKAETEAVEAPEPAPAPLTFHDILADYIEEAQVIEEPVSNAEVEWDGKELTARSILGLD